MRHNPDYAEPDAAVVRDLIDANPWATIVSSGKDELVASHYPVLLDVTTDDLAIVSHVDVQTRGYTPWVRAKSFWS